VTAEPRFQLCDPEFERLLRRARLGCHRLHGVKLLASDEVHSRQDALELLAQAAFKFVTDAGERAQRASGDSREVIEQSVLGLHRHLASARLSWAIA
jgi:hypothetical protein